MPENSHENITCYSAIRIASTKLDQRGYNGQAAQTTEFISVIEDTTLYSSRYPLVGRKGCHMSQYCLLNLADTLRWHIEFS